MEDIMAYGISTADVESCACPFDIFFRLGVDGASLLG